MGRIDRIVWILVGLGLSGCPCPTLEQAQVWDPYDNLSDDQAQEIRETMEDFAAWTGVSDLCVLGVKVAPILWPNAGAIYKGDDRWIKVEPDHIRPGMRSVTHELCHAWDATMGWPSLDNADVFRVEDTARSLNYWTDEARIRESFAEACDAGPAELGMDLGMEQVCGLELVDERERWLMDEVYRHYPSQWSHQGTASFSHSPVRLEGFTDLRGLITVDDRLLAYTKTSADRPVSFWSASPEWRGDEGEPSSALPTGNRYHLRELDPWTGETITSVEITDLIPPWDTHTRMLGGSGGPVFVTITDLETRGWRIDLDEASVSELSLPRLFANLQSGVALEDHIILHGTDAETWETRLMVVDPSDGSWEPIQLANHEAQGAAPARYQELGDDVLIAYNGANASSLLRYRPGTRVLERTPLISRDWSFVSGLHQLPDGRLLLSVWLLSEDYTFETRELLLMADPDSGGSWIAEGTCELDWELEHGLTGAALYSMVGLDGHTFYPATREGPNGERDWWLVHLGLPD